MARAMLLGPREMDTFLTSTASEHHFFAGPVQEINYSGQHNNQAVQNISIIFHIIFD
jgi:hypothetical protein